MKKCYICVRLITNAMKLRITLLAMAVAVLSSMPLSAQIQSESVADQVRYEGHWPEGEGILYSGRDGLIIGSFQNGRPEGKCVCYKPNGEVYWGDFKKGKATGNGRIYRDNGIVVAGQYKNGKYHGIDTLYRSNGTVFVGKFRKGKMKARISDSDVAPVSMAGKPEYPRVDLRRKQEDFLKELELLWEERNLNIRHAMGFVNPTFQGGGIEDFTLWVNSRVEIPITELGSDISRTVLVEFTVNVDGTLSEIHAVFGSNPALNEAAENAVAKSPKWEPGELKGEKRSVRLTVPVVFENQ